MFNFRFFAVCVIALLAVGAVVLARDASAVKTTSASPTRAPIERRLLNLERMNDADNYMRGDTMVPLPSGRQEDWGYIGKDGRVRRR